MRQSDSSSVLNTNTSPATGLSVLVVEDEEDTASYLTDRLCNAGWSVEYAPDGVKGLTLTTSRSFDVLIVDRMLPKLDGLSCVVELRARNVQTPVLFLTAMGAVNDRVMGLDLGGDDYLVKPFVFAELNSRIHALARRPPPHSREPTILAVGDLCLNRLTRRVSAQGIEIKLLSLEFRLLEFLMLNSGRIVTRKMLLEKVWGFDFDPRTNIVETHISHLRSKIQKFGGSPLIATVRKAGYIISAP
jgi:two-component system OmpR family response regulator